MGHKKSVVDNRQMENSLLEIEENYDVKKYFTLHQTSVQILQET